MSIIKNKDGLLFYQREAEKYMRQMCERSFDGGQDLHQFLYPYILCKYSLIDEAPAVYELDDLAELSVAKTIRLSKTEAFRADSASSCEGTTSAMNKKVLLLMAIQRELEIRFPAGTTADLTDTYKIADAVFALLQQKK